MNRCGSISALLRAAVVFCIGLAALSKTYPATFTNAEWVGMNGFGTDKNILACVYAKGSIYFGGFFLKVGNLNVNGIAQWDGVRLRSLGSGISLGGYFFSDVYALAVDSSGNLYAVAESQKYNNQGWPLTTLAKWNGSNWSAVVSPFYISATLEPVMLCCDRTGNLYVAGLFAKMSGIADCNIAQWNGSSWKALGKGMNGRVVSLVVDKNQNLYAGGEFDSAGGIAAQKIARWDGTKWDSVGLAIGNPTECMVPSIAVDDRNTMYVCIQYKNSNFIMKSNGGAWDTVGSSFYKDHSYNFVSMAFDKEGNLYVAGDNDSIMPSVKKWDGKTWNILGSLIVGDIKNLVIDDYGHIYAAGIIGTVGGKDSLNDWVGGLKVQNIITYNGNDWRPIRFAIKKKVTKLAYGKGKLYVGGTFTDTGGYPFNHVALLDSGNWHALGSGISGDISALATDANGDIVVGEYFSTGILSSVANIQKWDGVNWIPLATGISGYVAALVYDSLGILYAGGKFSEINGFKVENIARWDGTTWNSLGDGVYGSVSAFAFDNRGNLYVSGSFDTAGRVAAFNIAKWDGTAWKALGPGVPYGGSAIASNSNGQLYINGFKTISKWDGVMWDSIEMKRNKGVTSLICDRNGNLYAGGTFDTLGGIVINHIARWDGKTWSGLGFGVQGSSSAYVSSLAISDSILFVGGDFDYGGDKYSPNIASVNIKNFTNAILPKAEKVFSASIYCRITKSTLLISSVTPHDCVCLYSLSGRCVRQAEGISRMDLSGLSPQPLLIQIHRGGKIVSRGMVMAQ